MYVVTIHLYLQATTYNNKQPRGVPQFLCSNHPVNQVTFTKESSQKTSRSGSAVSVIKLQKRSRETGYQLHRYGDRQWQPEEAKCLLVP